MNKFSTVEHVSENGVRIKRLTTFDARTGTTSERVEQETGEFPALRLAIEPEAGREHVFAERAVKQFSRSK